MKFSCTAGNLHKWGVFFVLNESFFVVSGAVFWQKFSKNHRMAQCPPPQHRIWHSFFQTLGVRGLGGNFGVSGLGLGVLLLFFAISTRLFNRYWDSQRINNNISPIYICIYVFTANSKHLNS